MKTTTKTLFAALMLLAISCKKESNTIQSSSAADESNSQSLSSDASEPAATNAVKIGIQVWMTRNLDVTRYRNGDRIPYVASNAKWASLTTGAWCWYKNDSANGRIYGKLYNWYAVNDPRGLAPEGWHIPSDAEWTILTDYLGGESVAGGKMKSTGTIETGTGLWRAPNTGATNSSGFTGLPGGFKDDSGPFKLNRFGYWWSSTEVDASNAGCRLLFDGGGSIFGGSYYKFYGFSVRCLRD